MKTIEYRTIDKSTWELRGPWDDEPDKIQWQDAATGLPCLIVRHPRSGHFCGYVGVAEGHPSYGKGYDDVDVSVHGGLTFANACQPSETEASGICHVPEPGEPDHVWWLGFDCAHCNDLSPAHAKLHGLFKPHSYEVYRDLAYVRASVEGLAQQLKALA